MQDEHGYGKAMNQEFEIVDDDNSYSAKVCKNYLTAKLWYNFGILLIPLALETINKVAMIVCEIASKVMKFTNRTFEESALMTMKYLMTLFKGAVLVLLTNANFITFNIHYFDGDYTDLNDKWYVNVGSIFIIAMFFRLVISPGMIVVRWLLKKVLIMIDRRAIRPPKDTVFTSKNHNIDFADLYSGAKLKLSNPYNKVLLNVMISMMLGLGLPILFPFVLLFLVVIYFAYKSATLYWFKKPPKLDDSLSNLFMHNMKFAPLLYCGFSYWMLNNRQMFENYVVPKEHRSQIVGDGHTLFYNPNNHTYVLLVMFIVIALFLAFYEIFYD